MEFSLIMATYGRLLEVSLFLKSIQESEYDLSKIEVIIVDQNDAINLHNIIKSFQHHFQIKHIKSSTKGLSLNRNLGINASSGKIISFPDDDCLYPSNLLKSIEMFFNDNINISVIAGKAMDKGLNKDITKFKKNPQNISIVNLFRGVFTESSFFVRTSAIKDYYFDELMGTGSIYGSCEGQDFIYRLIKNNSLVNYNPLYFIYHPIIEKKLDKNNINKIHYYSLGMGAFFKKHIADIFNIKYLYSLIYALFIVPIGGIVLSLFRMNTYRIHYYYSMLFGRLRGFLFYPKKI